MKIENEDELDRYIICSHCHTLHAVHKLKDGTTAICSKCGKDLYSYNSQMINIGISLALSALIFFLIANLFPLVQIEVLGSQEFITIMKMLHSLFDSGFYFVGMLCGVIIFIFPLSIFTVFLILFTLLKLKKGRQLSKVLLVLLSYMIPWSMSDIFLVSILVALVKLVGMVEIHMGTSFWALIIFVLLELYMTHKIKLKDIWMFRRQVYTEVK